MALLLADPLAAARAQLRLARNGGPQLQDSDRLLATITADLHPGQAAFVHDQATEIIGVSAGYGAGKTRALCAKAVSLALANQGFLGCVMEPTGPLICRSFENWTRIIGLNLAWVLADEIDTVTPSIANKAFPKILGRLRSGNVRQFGAASTPEGFRWMWQTFGSEDAQQRADRRLIRMRTADNPHLPPDFIERLQANYDPSLLRAYLEGEFVNLTTGQVYDRFNREHHVVPCDWDEVEAETILLGVDFNVGNMSGVLAVRRGRELHVFDEVAGAHDTDALGQEIRRRYPKARILGYPDASGTARSTNSSRSDVAILQAYDISNQAPKANPPVRDRVAAVQALLENGAGERRLFIDPRCKRLIECLELQSYDEKGDPAKDTGYDHMNDALGYIVHRTFEVGRAITGKAVRGVRLY